MAKRNSTNDVGASAVEKADSEKKVAISETKDAETVNGDRLAALEAEIVAERRRTATAVAERDAALEEAKVAEELNKANATRIAEKEFELTEIRKTRELEENKTKVVKDGGAVCEKAGRYRCTRPCFLKGTRYDPDGEKKFQTRVFEVGEEMSDAWEKC